MKEIELKDAKAKLSAIIDDALNGNGTIVTRDGQKEAVIISYQEFERLSQGVPSFGWLLANSPLEEADLPERRPTPRFGKNIF